MRSFAPKGHRHTQTSRPRWTRAGSSLITLSKSARRARYLSRLLRDALQERERWRVYRNIMLKSFHFRSSSNARIHVTETQISGARRDAVGRCRAHRTASSPCALITDERRGWTAICLNVMCGFPEQTARFNRITPVSRKRRKFRCRYQDCGAAGLHGHAVRDVCALGANGRAGACSRRPDETTKQRSPLGIPRLSFRLRPTSRVRS